MAILEHHVFDDGELVTDERFFPVVIATWMGAVTEQSTAAYYRWYDRILDRAAAEGVRLQSITDLLGVDGLGACNLRWRLVEETDRREDRIREHVDYMMIVAQRALVRGTLAFVLCRVRRTVRLSSFTDVHSALARAMQRLEGNGVVWLAPAMYQRPTWSRATA